MIHFRNEEIQIRAHGSVQTPFMGTAYDWRDVTCGLCRLEEPLMPRAEYRVPEDVLRRDEALSRADRLRARRSLAEAVEREALRMIAEYRAVHSDARALSDRLTRLIETESAQEAPVGGTEGSESAETLSGAVSGYCVGPVPKMSAPVNAVDIRTESEEDRGMTNLSEAAVKALLSAPGNKIGAKVPYVPGPVRRELINGGLIGPEHGLTRKGSIERERRSEASAKALFGEV